MLFFSEKQIFNKTQRVKPFVKKIKGFTLIEVIVVSVIISILAASSYGGYKYFIKQTVISTLTNAVNLNVQLISAYYDIHGEWVTDVEPDNPNLTTDEELRRFGLAARNLSSDFMMRVFRLEGFPHVIAREQIGQNKYGVMVSYHFKDRILVVDDDFDGE